MAFVEKVIAHCVSLQMIRNVVTQMEKLNLVDNSVCSRHFAKVQDCSETPFVSKQVAQSKGIDVYSCSISHVTCDAPSTVMI